MIIVKHFPPEDNISLLFRDTDFALPIEYSTSESNNFTSFKANLFVPVHLAQLVLVSHFGACGCKCFSNALGIPNSDCYSYNSNFHYICKGVPWTTIRKQLGEL